MAVNVVMGNGNVHTVSDRLPDILLHSANKEEVYKAMREHDIIKCVDQDGKEYLMWGAALHRKIINKNEARYCKVMKIAVDSSDEFVDLRWVAAYVRIARGACCYSG